MQLNTSIEAFNCYKDLDKAFWLDRAEKEAKLIHSKPGPRRGRSLEEIVKTTAFGHAAVSYTHLRAHETR